jgi:hypothetical protein
LRLLTSAHGELDVDACALAQEVFIHPRQCGRRRETSPASPPCPSRL